MGLNGDITLLIRVITPLKTGRGSTSEWLVPSIELRLRLRNMCTSLGAPSIPVQEIFRPWKPAQIHSQKGLGALGILYICCYTHHEVDSSLLLVGWKWFIEVAYIKLSKQQTCFSHPEFTLWDYVASHWLVGSYCWWLRSCTSWGW